MIAASMLKLISGQGPPMWGKSLMLSSGTGWLRRPVSQFSVMMDPALVREEAISNVGCEGSSIQSQTCCFPAHRRQAVIDPISDAQSCFSLAREQTLRSFGVDAQGGFHRRVHRYSLFDRSVVGYHGTLPAGSTKRPETAPSPSRAYSTGSRAPSSAVMKPLLPVRSVLT